MKLIVLQHIYVEGIQAWVKLFQVRNTTNASWIPYPAPPDMHGRTIRDTAVAAAEIALRVHPAAN